MITTEDLRSAAHQKVDEADEKTLIAILSTGMPDSGAKESAMLSEAELAELERRVARYKNGESNAYSWDEVKQHIAAQRKNGL